MEEKLHIAGGTQDDYNFEISLLSYKIYLIDSELSLLVRIPKQFIVLGFYLRWFERV